MMEMVLSAREPQSARGSAGNTMTNELSSIGMRGPPGGFRSSEKPNANDQEYQSVAEHSGFASSERPTAINRGHFDFGNIKASRNIWPFVEMCHVKLSKTHDLVKHHTPVVICPNPRLVATWFSMHFITGGRDNSHEGLDRQYVLPDGSGGQRRRSLPQDVSACYASKREGGPIEMLERNASIAGNVRKAAAGPSLGSWTPPGIAAKRNYSASTLSAKNADYAHHNGGMGNGSTMELLMQQNLKSQVGGGVFGCTGPSCGPWDPTPPATTEGRRNSHH